MPELRIRVVIMPQAASVSMNEDLSGGNGAMNRRSKLAAVSACVLTVCCAFGAMALPAKNVEAVAADPIKLTVGVTQTVDSLNPFAGYLITSGVVCGLMYDTIVGTDKDWNRCPGIAESWSYNTAGTVWTYNIRHGMTWHDGLPVTAEDVNWTYNLILKNPVAGALWIDYLRNVTDVQTLDDYTVQITTEVPKASMLDIPIFIVPKHLWMNVPANKIATVDVFDTTYFPNGPIGSGPFKLVDYAIDDFVKFVKYENYYGGTVNFDELVYKIFLSEQAMLNALYAGSIDYTWNTPASAWETTINEPNIDGQTVREISLYELGINVCPVDLRAGGGSRNYETLNLSVRQAMAMATNKSQIVKDGLLGLGEEGDLLIPPRSVQWHYNLTDAEEYKFDIPAANDLLEASGYAADADGDGIRENETSGVELDFVFEYIVDNTFDETAAYMIEDWYAQIGIRASAMGVSESALISDWMGMKYDLFIWGWYGDFDPSSLLSVMTTGQIPGSHSDWSAWSDCFYSNPYYDALYIQQQKTVNVSARQAIVFEMQQILYHDAPYIVLSYPWGLYAHRTDRFTNWPDLTAHPGFTSDRLLFYELVPLTGNLPPQNVNAGLDTIAALGETRSLTGYAEDEDFATLNWSWKFAEPGGATNFRYGQTVSYTFSNLGTVTVTLTVRDSGGLEDQDVLSVTVQPIPNASRLAGYVRDADDRPIIAATVTTGSTSATTNAAGYYYMTLSAGVYDVTADAQGYKSASQTATVVEGATTMLNFSLISSSGSLRGHIYEKGTTDPVEDAVVSVRMGDITKLAMSNSTGAYQISLLEAGTYSVNVTKANYETNMTQVVIQIGQEKVLDIYLESEKGGGGLSTAALAAIAAIVVVVIVAAVALMLMKRKKAEAPPPPPETPKT